MRAALLLSLMLLPFISFGQLRFEHDENVSPASSLPRDFTVFDGRLFFVADDGYHGREIWCHDPSSEQTYLVSDFSRNHDVNGNGKLTVFKQSLIFSGESDGERKLWRLRSGESQPELVPIPDSLQQLNMITATENHLYWISSVGGVRYLVQMDDQDNLLQAVELASSSPLNVAALEEDIYVFLRGGEGVRRFSPTLGLLDTVARNVLGRQDITRYLATTVSNGKLVMVGDLRTSRRLMIYDPAVDSLFINETGRLEGNNTITPLVSVNGRIFVHEIVEDEGIRVREYLPESDTFRRPEGISQWQDQYYLFQEFEGQLLLSGKLAPGTTLPVPLFYNTETNEASEGPDLGASLDHSSTQQYGERQITFLDGNWYYAGANQRGDIELYRYQPSSREYAKLSDVHQGTNWAGIWQIQAYGTDQILVSGAGWTYRFHPGNQEAVDLADDIPGLEWDYYSTVHPLPGHLAFGNVTYRDTFYRAIAYDSSQQLMVPILTNDVVCNFNHNKWIGPFVEWNGEWWFSACAEGAPTNQSYLFRYTPGAVAERILVDGRAVISGVPSSQTIISLEDRLFFVTDSSIYNSQYEMMTYHLVEGARRINSPIKPSFLVQMNTADSVAYYQARPTPNFDEVTLAYQSGGRISVLSVGTDSLSLRGRGAVTKVPGDHRHYLLASGATGIGIYRFDPTMDTTGIMKMLPADIRWASGLAHHQGRLYFAAETGAFGNELHEYNLSTDVVQRIADIRPGQLDGGANHLLSFGERLYFDAVEEFRGRELWSYRADCFSIDISASPSHINRPTGEVSLSLEDGTAPYQYTWSNGETSAFLENMAAGFYEVTVTDDRGCTGSASIWVETDGIISATEELASEPVKVYPNPFQGQLQLEFPLGSQVATQYAVYSMGGQRQAAGRVPAGDRVLLELGTLSSGLHVLVLFGESGEPLLVKKVVKR